MNELCEVTWTKIDTIKTMTHVMGNLPQTEVEDLIKDEMEIDLDVDRIHSLVVRQFEIGNFS